MSDSSFYAILSRMKYIKRWGLMHNTSSESLSEHVLDVAILTHALCLIGNGRLGKGYDAAAALTSALYHDCGEILTGDLPTPVKYANSKITDAYREIEAASAQKLLSFLPDDLAESYAPSFECADPEVKKLVKAADKLSALIKCIEEEKFGNTEFKTAKAATLTALKGLDSPEANIFLEEFIPAYSHTLDELYE